MRNSGFALPRLLKWIGIAVAALVLIVAALLYWLLATESGARFALARVIGTTVGKLAVEKSSGSLGGPLTLDGVRWHDPVAGVDVKVGRVRIDLVPLALFAKRVHITSLAIDHLDVTLTTVPPQPEQRASQFSLTAPIDVVLDRLALKQATISQDGNPVFALDSLDLGGAWTRDGFIVKSLALRSPDGSIDLHGTMSSLAGYPGNGETTFRWKVGDVAYAGTLKANGDGKFAHLDLALAEPTPANVVATVTQSHDLPWTAKVTVPRFDPNKVQNDSTLIALALNLEGSGDKDHGALDGEVDINEHRVQLEPLRYALDGPVLKIEALTLKSPQAAGTLNAHGEVQLDAKPVSATLALDWKGVELPADLVGQPLATHGKLAASGSAEKFHAEGTLAIGPPGKLSDLALNLDGTPELITLKQLALKQAKGGLDVQGTLKLKPVLGWHLTAKANKFDPGAFAAQWPGAIDFDLATDGTLTDKGPDATIKLDRLGGALRKRPVSGNADLKIKPDYIVDGTLDIASGKSRVEVTGRSGNQTDATVKLAIASLGDWLPNSSGHLDGEFRVQGRWPKLAISGSAHGAQIDYAATQVGTLDLTANIADIQSPQGTLDLKAAKISSGSLAFDTLTLNGSGTQSAHELDLDATGTPLGFKLAGRQREKRRPLERHLEDARCRDQGRTTARAPTSRATRLGRQALQRERDLPRRRRPETLRRRQRWRGWCGRRALSHRTIAARADRETLVARRSVQGRRRDRRHRRHPSRRERRTEWHRDDPFRPGQRRLHRQREPTAAGIYRPRARRDAFATVDARDLARRARPRRQARWRGHPERRTGNRADAVGTYRPRAEQPRLCRIADPRGHEHEGPTRRALRDRRHRRRAAIERRADPEGLRDRGALGGPQAARRRHHGARDRRGAFHAQRHAEIRRRHADPVRQRWRRRERAAEGEHHGRRTSSPRTFRPRAW